MFKEEEYAATDSILAAILTSAGERPTSSCISKHAETTEQQYSRTRTESMHYRYPMTRRTPSADIRYLNCFHLNFTSNSIR